MKAAKRDAKQLEESKVKEQKDRAAELARQLKAAKRERDEAVASASTAES